METAFQLDVKGWLVARDAVAVKYPVVRLSTKSAVKLETSTDSSKVLDSVLL